VALVGTSFSAKSDWNFLGFLQNALAAEVLNFSAEGQGPFAPMQTFLASDTFKNTPPKLVIWEIPVRYTSMDMIK
jgi:alginate O-acetyltransferase complex protein AlgJ